MNVQVCVEEYKLRVTASFPERFEFYQNGSLISSSTFEDVISTISVDLGILEIGLYNHTIIVYDTSNHSISSSIQTTVTDRSIEKKKNMGYVSSIVGLTDIYDEAIVIIDLGAQIVKWRVHDTLPKNYVLFKDGLEIENNDWVSGDEISLEFKSWNPPGTFKYTLLVMIKLVNRVQTQYLLQSLERTYHSI